MAVTERHVAAPSRSERNSPTSPTAADLTGSEPRGFRPASRRRSRVALGVLLAAIAVGGNALLYASLNDRTEVLQLASDVRAGEVVTTDDLRVVGADLDPTVPTVAADEIDRVIGRYARVFLPAGSLVVEGLVQTEPLVSDGFGVVEVDVELVPAGVTTRSQILLVVPDGSNDPFVTSARVVRRPATDGSSGSTRSMSPSMSVEVPVDVAPRVAAADGIRVVLVEPGIDPATDNSATANGTIDNGATANSATDSGATDNSATDSQATNIGTGG